MIIFVKYVNKHARNITLCVEGRVSQLLDKEEFFKEYPTNKVQHSRAFFGLAGSTNLKLQLKITSITTVTVLSASGSVRTYKNRYFLVHVTPLPHKITPMSSTPIRDIIK